MLQFNQNWIFTSKGKQNKKTGRKVFLAGKDVVFFYFTPSRHWQEFSRTLRHDTRLMLPLAQRQNPKLLLTGTTDSQKPDRSTILSFSNHLPIFPFKHPPFYLFTRWMREIYLMGYRNSPAAFDTTNISGSSWEGGQWETRPVEVDRASGEETDVGKAQNKQE